MFLKKVNQKETHFSHIAMCINASETPFFEFNHSMFLCVKKISTPKGLFRLIYSNLHYQINQLLIMPDKS